MADSEVEDPSLLVIALDTNPSQRILKKNPQAGVLTNMLNSVSSFANSHLMQTPQNKLAIVACHHHTSKFLYPSEKNLEVRQIDGQHEYFTLIEKSVKTNLAELVISAPPVKGNCESMLAGCLARCLCYILRVSSFYIFSQHPETFFVVEKVTASRIEPEHKNIGCDWKRRFSSPVHDIHERVLHSSKGKGCHRRLCLG